MVENPKPTELLDRKAGRVAGAMSVLLGLCGVAAVVAWSVETGSVPLGVVWAPALR